MTKARILGGAVASVVCLLVIAAGFRAWNREEHAPTPPSPAVAALTTAPPPAAASAEGSQGFLYGRITTVDGETLEGRLRWGGGHEEAFWGDYFNGSKRENSWLAKVPIENRPMDDRPLAIFGFKIADRKLPSAVRRQLMVPFGELARVESRGREVLVTLKSGTMVELDRFEASDFDDDVRVWDQKRGVVDFNSLRIRSIELLPTPPLADCPARLHATVHTKQGDFTGFLQWNRAESTSAETFDGHNAGGAVSLRFDTIRSIERRSGAGAVATLLDGREIVVDDLRGASPDDRGTYVDDRRYGRVLIAWNAIERVDFSPGGSGPAYGDFPPGRPITGSVVTRDGRRLSGRLVYDLDESETTDTLDASSVGVDYTIPFGRISSIVVRGGEEPVAPSVRVTLQNGEELQLARTGDLGPSNAGILIFTDGGRRSDYVPWADVVSVELDRSPVLYP